MATVAEVDLLKRQFLAALNHEVRTPLSGIMGMTNLLEQTRLSPEQQEYLALTKACVEELYQVLSSTLEFTALAAGETKVDNSDFPLQETIEAVAAHWLVQARKKGLGFRLRLSDDLPEAARGDEIRIRQILQHLLSNAVKFTEAGEVTLEAKVRGLHGPEGVFWLDLSIEDTGIGIEATQKDRIFESFEQLENGLARRYPGLGLGLTLAQGLCRLLGGEMGLESEAGKGSRFSVSIPLETSSIEPRGQLDPASKWILVVDDNEAARKVAWAFLKRDGYQVELAEDGMAGIEAARGRRFDLVLMDLQMPEMDGLETVARLRRIEGYAQTPVIALTANAGEEYRRLCKEHGMQGFVTKPVESELLLRSVRQLL
jgi:CheY-like chemotaxis protein/two-component sensor histidine kinase